MATQRTAAKAGAALAAEGERVVLRAPARADEGEFLALRRASREFLAPWEADIEGRTQPRTGVAQLSIVMAASDLLSEAA